MAAVTGKMKTVPQYAQHRKQHEMRRTGALCGNLYQRRHRHVERKQTDAAEYEVQRLQNALRFKSVCKQLCRKTALRNDFIHIGKKEPCRKAAVRGMPVKCALQNRAGDERNTGISDSGTERIRERVILLHSEPVHKVACTLIKDGGHNACKKHPEKEAVRFPGSNRRDHRNSTRNFDQQKHDSSDQQRIEPAFLPEPQKQICSRSRQ